MIKMTIKFPKTKIQPAVLLAFTLLMALPGVLWAAETEFTLSGMFTDNAVLQRGMPVPVWGTASPGTIVTVEFNGQTHQATTTSEGRWCVALDPMTAGGSYKMTVSGPREIKLENILVGEVWICSGQSNMEMGIKDTANAKEAIAMANQPEIRLFKLNKQASEVPFDDVQNVRWKVCSPKTVIEDGWGGFSAVAYYFGRDLHEALQVPVGLIESDWGGTPAEAWTELSALGQTPEGLAYVEKWNRNQENRAREDSETVKANREVAYRERLARWENARKQTRLPDTQTDLGMSVEASSWLAADFDDSNWKTMQLPTEWETAPDTGDAFVDLDGAVWFRTRVEIPEEDAGKDLTLSLGAIDDFDTTYFNGQKVGATGKEIPGFWSHKRVYVVPGSLVRGGSNTIAVRVFDHMGGGGMVGPAKQMYVTTAGGQSISLAGPWKYALELPLDALQLAGAIRPRLYTGEPVYFGPAYLYNAMIHPLAPYAVRGAIWYQGEANSGRADSYCGLLATMIQSWRRLWGQEAFAFHIVSLASYMAPTPKPTDEGWANLRWAQYQVAKHDPQNGLAVTTDIGDDKDIHPKNKRDVGGRLALVARGITYGEEVVYSGPEYVDMETEGNTIRLRFDHTGTGLVASGGELQGFAIAGANHQFVWAQAAIDGDTVIVWSDEVAEPVAVRYAWHDNTDTANLFNQQGLPAIPFATDK